MAVPLKQGRSIRVEHIKKPSDYAMRTTEAYTDYYGIGYLISGARKMITPSGIYFTQPGDIGIVTMGMYHQTVPSASDEKIYERYGVKFAPKMVVRLIETIGEEKFQEFMSHNGYHLKQESQKKVEQIFKDMFEEYENYDDTSELVLEGMLNHLIILLMKERILYTSFCMNIDVQDDLIMHVLEYLDVHYAENPTIEELAEISCLSRAQFMKRFKMAVGSSYKTYLNCYKVSYAQCLLTKTKQPISEIAEELGFCNANYFCNVFKEICSESPSEFRKRNRF